MGIHWSAHSMACCVPSRPAMPTDDRRVGRLQRASAPPRPRRSRTSGRGAPPPRRSTGSAARRRTRRAPGSGRPRDVGAVVGELLDVPADPDAEVEPSARQLVEGGDGLGEREQVVLEGQGDAGADPQVVVAWAAASRLRNGSIIRRYAGRQLSAGRVGRAPRGRDVGVLADPERRVPVVLQARASSPGADVLGGVHRREAELQRSSVRCGPSASVAYCEAPGGPQGERDVGGDQARSPSAVGDVRDRGGGGEGRRRGRPPLRRRADGPRRRRHHRRASRRRRSTRAPWWASATSPRTRPIELLCTKPGAGSLSLGDAALLVKGAKPLPSSD